MRLTYAGFIAVLFLTAQGHDCFAVEEPYYTWVDENGVVNFAQGQPKGVNAKLISKGYRFGQKVVEGTRVQPVSASLPELVGNEQDAAVTGSQAGADFEKTMQEIKRVKQANCEGARKNLSSYLSRGRIRLQGEDGEYRILPGEERQANIRRFQNDIDENC